jgi:hypothetical protein
LKVRINRTETQIQFRQKLAFDLITYMDDVRENAKGITPERLRSRNKREHMLMTAPGGSKFVGGKWQKCLKDKYQTYRCKHPGCKKRVRTVCSCSPEVWRCKECHLTHVVEEVISH